MRQSAAACRRWRPKDRRAYRDELRQRRVGLTLRSWRLAYALAVRDALLDLLVDEELAGVLRRRVFEFVGLPSGLKLAAASADGTIRAVDGRSGATDWEASVQDRARALSWTRTGALVAAGFDDRIRVVAPMARSGPDGHTRDSRTPLRFRRVAISSLSVRQT